MMEINKSDSDNIYYVYAYLRKDGSPYYIGKGCGDRIHNKNHTLNLPSEERRVFLKENLLEQDALDLEVEYISKYGRKDLGTGILRNRSPGGVGGDTSIYIDYERQSQLKKGKPNPKAAIHGSRNRSWGITTYELTDPAGKKHIVSGGYVQWCKDRGLNQAHLRSVALGNRKHHKGWTSNIIKSERCYKPCKGDTK